MGEVCGKWQFHFLLNPVPEPTTTRVLSKDIASEESWLAVMPILYIVEAIERERETRLTSLDAYQWNCWVATFGSGQWVKQVLIRPTGIFSRRVVVAYQINFPPCWWLHKSTFTETGRRLFRNRTRMHISWLTTHQIVLNIIRVGVGY